MKISASIYSSTKKSLEDSIRELDELNIDMIHVDFNDKKSDGKTVFADIKNIKTLTSKAIDLHIISDTPSNYFQYIKELNIEYVTFQHENITEKLSIPKISNTKFGIAVISETPVQIIEEYNKIDFIRAMFV